MKSELTEFKTERLGLQEKISKLETEHDQSRQTVSQYSEIIQRQKKEIAELRERIESLVLVKSDFTRSVVYFQNNLNDISFVHISTIRPMVKNMIFCEINH